MATFVLATIIFVILFAGMAIGVIFANKPIKGSCGGLNNIGLGDGECELCGGNRSKCEEINADKKSAPEATSALAYDATRKQ
ncbi:MAG: (Na+)-NQR maturation NqrM [Gammaproteobacteria bacterium]